jgi:cephalosporin-C deacetylase-like acetyl esterase
MRYFPVANLIRTLVAGVLLASPFASAAQPASAQALSFKPYHEDGIYDAGEKAGWTVTPAPAAPGAPVKWNYVIRKNNFDVIQRGTLDLSSGSAVIEATLAEPAMLYVELTPADAPAPPPSSGTSPAPPKPVKPIHLGAAFAPWKIQPAAPRPADFDAFWDAKLKALDAVPVNAVLTPTPTSTPGVDFYTVKLDSLGSHVQGYLAKPSREGKFPAIMLYQWAGVYALLPEIAAKRAAEGWLVFNVDSHDLPPDQATGVPNDYAKVGNTSRETSYFLNMYLRDKRAIDYIASRPEWDGKTLVVLGTSMGGHQSLVAAALDARVTALIVNEPSGANGTGEKYGYQTGYPNWTSDDPKVMEAAPYFDTINFAPRIKAPLLAAIGFIDTTCPPAGLWMVVNQVPGRKEVIGMIESDHNNLTPDKQGAWDARSKEVLNLVLAGQEFQPNESTAHGK